MTHGIKSHGFDWHGHGDTKETERAKLLDHRARSLGFFNNDDYQKWKMIQNTEFEPEKYTGLTRKALIKKGLLCND